MREGFLFESHRVWKHIKAERMFALAFELVGIPSPTQDNHRVAERIGRELADIGLAVELYRPFTESTVAVGRLCGAGNGPTLEFSGHCDVVPVDHAPPQVRNGQLHGRGSVDMKGNIASLLEALRALVESGVRLKGDILVTSHGLHESPGKYEHNED